MDAWQEKNGKAPSGDFATRLNGLVTGLCRWYVPFSRELPLQRFAQEAGGGHFAYPYDTIDPFGLDAKEARLSTFRIQRSSTTGL
ncbi:MAG: hypothetical protein IPH08_05870 [Rhodocyclaceae bacterium]|nr:hypothetical protein [Rhodocyclaceae bacterium]